MIDLSLLAAILLGIISLSGLLVNIYSFIKLSTQKRPFSGFHKLCIVKLIPNSIVCFTFLVWSTPLCVLNPTFMTIPRNVNVAFGQVAGWGAYVLGPCLQVCMSFNRFYVLYFPVKFMKFSRLPFTNVSIFIAFCIAVVYTVIGLPGR
uniref:7TM_GPCR_Srx domain-containing protein n=2 Tax=Caenorhabditis japonica TaxID=281687 RepID=A0A8R1IE06_CAEJA